MHPFVAHIRRCVLVRPFLLGAADSPKKGGAEGRVRESWGRRLLETRRLVGCDSRHLSLPPTLRARER